MSFRGTRKRPTKYTQSRKVNDKSLILAMSDIKLGVNRQVIQMDQKTKVLVVQYNELRFMK